MDLPAVRPTLNYFISAVLALLLVLLLVGAGMNGFAALSIGWIGWLTYCASHSGQEISLDKQRMRAYYGWGGWRLGSWQPLPPVAGVTVKYFSQRGSGPSPSRTSWSTWDTSSIRYEKLVMLLSVTGSASGLIIGRYSLAELPALLQLARAIGNYLDVPVRTYIPAHSVSLP